METLARTTRSSILRNLSIGAGVCVIAGTIAVTGRSQQDAEPAAPAAGAAYALSATQEARDLVEVLEARLNIKKAELHECEVHLQQAKRRLSSLERLQLSDYQQALERVRWAEGMFKKGYMNEALLRVERDRAERLNPNPGGGAPASDVAKAR